MQPPSSKFVTPLAIIGMPSPVLFNRVGGYWSTTFNLTADYQKLFATIPGGNVANVTIISNGRVISTNYYNYEARIVPLFESPALNAWQTIVLKNPFQTATINISLTGLSITTSSAAPTLTFYPFANSSTPALLPFKDQRFYTYVMTNDYGLYSQSFCSMLMLVDETLGKLYRQSSGNAPRSNFDLIINGWDGDTKFLLANVQVTYGPLHKWVFMPSSQKSISFPVSSIALYFMTFNNYINPTVYPIFIKHDTDTYLLEYPFGFSNGSMEKYDLAFDLVQHINYPSPSELNIQDNQTVLLSTHDIAIPQPYIRQPLLENFEFLSYTLSETVLRLNISTDILDGVWKIKYSLADGSVREFAAEEYIVSGTPSECTLEFIIDHFSMPPPTIFPLTIQSKARPPVTYTGKEMIYSSYRKAYSSIPPFVIPGASSITVTSITFQSNNVDLSTTSMSNTMFITVQNPEPTFKPILNMSFDGIAQSYFRGNYDPATNRYVIAFTMPVRLLSGPVAYNLYIDRYYSWTSIAGTFGNSSILRVASLGSIRKPAITDIISLSTTSSFGWNLKINSYKNGISSIKLTIRGSLDMKPRIHDYNPYIPIGTGGRSVTFTFNIENKDISQVFTITDIVLTDARGFATTSMDEAVHLLTPSQMQNLSIAVVSTNPPIPTTFMPKIVSFSVTPSVIDVHGVDRNVTFTLTTQSVSSRQTPVVYINDIRDRYLNCVTTFVHLTNDFQCTISLPYAFGSYDNITISVYGIVDQNMTGSLLEVTLDGPLRPFKIWVIVGGKKSNELFVTPIKLPPVDPIICVGKPPCNGNGQCDAIVGYIVSPTTSAQIEAYKAIVSVVAVREYDTLGVMVHEDRLLNWKFTNKTTNGTTVFTYYAPIGITQASLVAVNIQMFTSTTMIRFAGEDLVMVPYSIKYTIEVSNYPFAAKTNTLQVIMRTGLQSGETTNDQCESFDRNDETNDLQWIKINVNDKSIFGRFVRRGEVDGRIVVVSNKIIDRPDYESSSEKSTYIGLNIPNFSDTALLDPDFSLLVNQNGDSCGHSKSGKLSLAQIIGIAVGGAVFLVIMAIGAYLILKRRYYISGAKLVRMNTYTKKN
eukprot:gene7967-9361_t